MQYLIGVSPRIEHLNNKVYVKCYRNYLDRLIEIGLCPIILTPNSDLTTPLALCSGFLVIGGDDFNPLMYNEDNNLGLSKDIDDEADLVDKQMIEYAVKYHIPVLGICRGHQALSAVFGKALYQDINYAKLDHPCENSTHMVTKVNNFGLAKLLPDCFLVNSYHHQATKTLPNDFIILFKNHDIIEAIEHKILPIVGIQWHPERLSTNESEIIFNYFKEQVIDYENNKK